MDFIEVRDVVFAAHGRADYRSGLDAIDAYAGAIPEEVSDLAYWRMCLLSRLGETEAACVEFARRLGEGYWWGEAILADADFDNVRNHTRWKQLVSISLSRAAEVSSDPRQPIDVRPTVAIADTLVLFHGAGSHAQFMIDRYRSVVEHGYRLLALHGTERMSSHRFSWSAVEAEKAALSQLREVGNPEQPILTGFSQGAGVAGHLAWEGKYQAGGVMLVAPSLGIRGVPISSRAIHTTPTYILAGTDDRAIEDIRRGAAALRASGVPVRLDERPNLGHDWPADFSETLLRAVDWIHAARP
ncbi:alpha/beta hydrolase family protein [bacterium BMS3Bbin02]|nr:alpha/beta hydrolase family protein [bacterium BMS3Bbin02]